MTRPIGIAIIGLGAAVSPHAKALLELTDRARVVWAAARDPARTRAAAEAYGFPVTNDIRAAINDPAVDAVMVLTPANTHLDIADAAFAAGKHVLCENRWRSPPNAAPAWSPLAAQPTGAWRSCCNCASARPACG